MDPSMPMQRMEKPTKTDQASQRQLVGSRARRNAATIYTKSKSTATPAVAPAHSMGSMQGMDTANMQRHEAPNSPAPPAAVAGPKHAADGIYGQLAMERSRERLREEQGGFRTYKILIDQLESRIQKGENGYRWSAQGWYGGDIDKLWIKTEGAGTYSGKLEQGEIQVLWSRAVSPWFDVQSGIRYDFKSGPKRTHAVLGLQGLMPYAYNIEAALFLSNKGELTGRFSAEYDLLITQKLILQPRGEINLSARNMRELGMGRGVSTIEAGLRLRYEFIPEFAPYIGWEYERKVGVTANFARQRGEKVGNFRYLAGLRSWF